MSRTTTKTETQTILSLADLDEAIFKRELLNEMYRIADGFGIEGGSGRCRMCSPSTDPRDTMRVIDNRRKAGFYFESRALPTGSSIRGWSITFGKSLPLKENDVVINDSYEVAVCLAALRTVGVDVVLGLGEG